MAIRHSIPTVVVSEEVIYCDGKLIAEMSDGSLLQFSIARAPMGRDLTSYGAFGWKYKTRDELAAKVHEVNRDAVLGANEALRLDKVRRLGWDHAQRGY